MFGNISMGQNLGKKSFESNVRISNMEDTNIDLDSNESAPEVDAEKSNHHREEFVETFRENDFTKKLGVDDDDVDNDLDKDLDKYDKDIIFEDAELYHQNLDMSDTNLVQLSEYQK